MGNKPSLAEARGDAVAMLQAAIDAVEPERLVRDALDVQEGRLRLDSGEVPGDRVRLAAFGKAAPGMARAAKAALPDARGVLATTPGVLAREGLEAGDDALPGVAAVAASHPLPDAGSLEAGRRLLDLARGTPEDGALLVLVSGGGSALAEDPAVPLEDLQRATDLLMRGGADILALNTVRKHLSNFKGGRLAAACPGRVVALILSDVLGDPVEFIASGPTAPDTTTWEDAKAALVDHDVWDGAPASVREAVAAGVAGERPETPKPGAALFDRVENRVVGSNAMAVEAAVREAARRGYDAKARHEALRGEAREMAREVAREAVDLASGRPDDAPPAAVVLGGETTVTVRGGGKGGRNQEFALAAVAAIAGRPVVVASAGTDGIDGPTDAAGAVASGETAARAAEAGLDPEAFLEDNDAYHFFESLDGLVVTGPTGTNVMDVAVALAL